MTLDHLFNLIFIAALVIAFGLGTIAGGAGK